jgi:hypothetical protein
MGRDKKCIPKSVGKYNGKYQLGDVINRRVILKLILEGQCVRVWTVFKWASMGFTGRVLWAHTKEPDGCEVFTWTA